MRFLKSICCCSRGAQQPPLVDTTPGRLARSCLPRGRGANGGLYCCQPTAIGNRPVFGINRSLAGDLPARRPVSPPTTFMLQGGDFDLNH